MGGFQYFQCGSSERDILTMSFVRSPVGFFSFLRISIYVRQGGRTCCLKAGVGSCSGTRISTESKKPSTAAHTLPRGSRLPSASRRWEHSFPDTYGPALSQFYSPLCYVYGQTAETFILLTIPHSLKRMTLS